MDPITCAHAHPYLVQPDGTFACSCGQLLDAADIEPDTGRVWTVDSAGDLVLLDDPRAALQTLQDAVRDMREAAEYPCPQAVRKQATGTLRGALAALRVAAAHGMRP
jgi:ClpP class serine protease